MQRLTMVKSFFFEGLGTAGIYVPVIMGSVPRADFLLPQAACYNFSAFFQWHTKMINAYRVAKRGNR
jgi:hypothetical protein